MPSLPSVQCRHLILIFLEHCYSAWQVFHGILYSAQSLITSCLLSSSNSSINLPSFPKQTFPHIHTIPEEKNSHWSNLEEKVSGWTVKIIRWDSKGKRSTLFLCLVLSFSRMFCLVFPESSPESCQSTCIHCSTAWATLLSWGHLCSELLCLPTCGVPPINIMASLVFRCIL